MNKSRTTPRGADLTAFGSGMRRDFCSVFSGLNWVVFTKSAGSLRHRSKKT
ncbi:MAG: hypothetical protein HN736_11735 [Anaerolineae bacterium]|nr:hypothetical protein [Anaerolineae bacterium]MBT3712391.1 hypothetical protein [Anaerolineae bacterium]MBT4311986.1 hypothetical protein [Anaerolineae bacterium]MBT4458134.1 hypothetical protein [Anaerolineae bacterium]MBT6059573.1 hypothetical protein [Anaerolineae bacterium]